MSYKVSDIVAFGEHCAAKAENAVGQRRAFMRGRRRRGDGALLALDITDAVAEEAQSRGTNLIISHHPLVFRPLRR